MTPLLEKQRYAIEEIVEWDRYEVNEDMWINPNDTGSMDGGLDCSMIRDTH